MKNNSYIYMVMINLLETRGWAPGCWSDMGGRLSVLGAASVAVYGFIVPWSDDPLGGAPPEGLSEDTLTELNSIWESVYDEIMEFSGWSLERWEAAEERTQEQVVLLLEALILSTQMREMSVGQDDSFD